MSSDLPRRAWSPHEVASQLDLNYKSVLALIHAGKLGALKTGRIYRIPEVALERYLLSACDAKPA